MTTSSPFNLRWGILATGGISHKFTRDILMDPLTRGCSDVSHSLVAVASSSSLSKAHTFIQDISAEINAAKWQTGPVRPYGSYHELCADKDVDIVYIGSPHSDHYKTCLLALQAGKHVLCEKAFTLNAPQAAHLCAIAKALNLFLLEAQWTRFFPNVLYLQSLLHSPQSPLGKLTRMSADFSFSKVPDASHRLFDPAQGGGALLDVGVYPILWAFLLFYRHPENGFQAPSVMASVTKAAITPVDDQDIVILKWDKLGVQCVCTTSLRDNTPEPWAMVIQGEKGSIYIPYAICRPSSYTLHLYGQEPQLVPFDIPGQGMHWQADACARSIRLGELESAVLPHVESVEIMRVMDAVRAVGGVHYGVLEELVA